MLWGAGDKKNIMEIFYGEQIGLKRPVLSIQ